MNRTCAAALILLLLSAGTVQAADLAAFLRQASAASGVAKPVRGDGTLLFKTPDSENRDQVMVAMRPPQDLYLELRKSGVRVLLLHDGAEAYVVEKTSVSPVHAKADTEVPDTNFTIEELRPFNISHYGSPRIADEGPDEMMVAMDPKVSQYVLTVATFDRTKRVPLKVQYYKDSPSNLFKMRRNEDYVSVADRWLPDSIGLEQFALRTTTELALRWKPASDLPEDLFDPASLRRPSAIHWPELPPAP